MFDFKIRHRPGKENGAADALSRRTDFQDKNKNYVHDAMLRKEADDTIMYNHPRTTIGSVRTLREKWSKYE